MLGVGASSLLCLRGENQDLSEPEKNFHFRGFSAPCDSAAALDKIVDEFKDAEGIIIDVRQNGGGDDRVGKNR